MSEITLLNNLRSPQNFYQQRTGELTDRKEYLLEWLHNVPKNSAPKKTLKQLQSKYKNTTTQQNEGLNPVGRTPTTNSKSHISFSRTVKDEMN